MSPLHHAFSLAVSHAPHAHVAGENTKVQREKGMVRLQSSGETRHDWQAPGLPGSKAGSHATTHNACQAPNPSRRGCCGHRASPGSRPGGRGPCLPLPSQSPKLLWLEGARTDTRHPIWPSCLPCRRITGTHPVSSPSPPPCPGPHAPAACRVLAVWMSSWAELEGPLGAAGALSLGQAGEAR